MLALNNYQVVDVHTGIFRPFSKIGSLHLLPRFIYNPILSRYSDEFR